MEISVFEFDQDVDQLTDHLKTAAEQGFTRFWTPQVFGLDALTAFAVAAKDVPNIRVGTAVIPTYPRHPMMLAQQALTVQSVIGNRLDLGIGLSHKPVVEGMWGIGFERPVAHLRDYLSVLMPLLTDHKVNHSGEMITGRGEITPPPAEAPPVLVAALGPQMLRLTGRMADGTITWMTGPKTLAELTAPTINEAAQAAGRPAPQVVAAFPICVTNDVDAARERAAREYVIYGTLPSYRAMIDNEGLSGPEDLAIIGTAAEVGDRIRALASCGVTCFGGSSFGNSDEREATRELLVQLAAA